MKITLEQAVKFYNLEILKEDVFGKNKFAVCFYQKKYYIPVIINSRGYIEGRLHSYRTQEEAQNVIEGRKNSILYKEKQKTLSKIKAKENFEKVECGEIFCMGWGYEAHIYDFYQVVGKKAGKCSLRLLKVKRDYSGAKYGWASNGLVTPIKDAFANDEVINKKIDNNNSFYFKGYGVARRWDGKTREEANWH